jgi:signal transduction histidine kinase
MEFHQEEQVLSKMVLRTLSLYRESATRKSISMNFHVPESIMVFMDNKMVESILRNLISNAIKFTPRQGTITVTAKMIPEEKVLVSVSDTGIGINKEMQDNLFKLDAKINRLGTDDEPSTGLGLLLCHEFVRMHGGKLWVESVENQGSTFFFTLPSRQKIN